MRSETHRQTFLLRAASRRTHKVYLCTVNAFACPRNSGCSTALYFLRALELLSLRVFHRIVTTLLSGVSPHDGIPRAEHVTLPPLTSHSTNTMFLFLNPLPPNDICMCCTAPLTSRRCILNISSTNVHIEYFKYAA
jgi:hypothetical protein